MYQFTDALLIGNPTIDNEHKMLFRILNEAQEELSKGFSPREALIRMKEYLCSYAGTHFEHEEAYMRKINDPELPIQLAEHQHFRDHISEIGETIENAEDARTEMTKLIEFVAKWLYQHIINSDSLIGKIPRIEKDQTESAFSFTSNYLTGIEKIDAQHKKLFKLVERAYNALHDSKYISEVECMDQVLNIMDELTKYTSSHFRDEEEYMNRIGYEGLDAQVKAHVAFIDKISDISTELDQSELSWETYLDDVIDYLLFWLSSHILKMDTQIPCVELPDD